MKPINVSTMSAGGRKRLKPALTVDTKDEIKSDSFDLELNRIRGPRLIKGEALDLQQFPLLNKSGDFPPDEIRRRESWNPIHEDVSSIIIP